MYLKQMYTDVMTTSNRITISTAPSTPTPTLSPIGGLLLESESSCEDVGTGDGGGADVSEGNNDECVREGAWEVKCEDIEADGAAVDEGSVPPPADLVLTGVTVVVGDSVSDSVSEKLGLLLSLPLPESPLALPMLNAPPLPGGYIQVHYYRCTAIDATRSSPFMSLSASVPVARISSSRAASAIARPIRHLFTIASSRHLRLEWMGACLVANSSTAQPRGK